MSGVSIVALVLWLIASTIGLRLLSLWSRQRRINPLLYGYSGLLVGGPAAWLIHTITGGAVPVVGWVAVVFALATLVVGEVLLLRWYAQSGGERITGSIPPAMIYTHAALTVGTAALTLVVVLVG